MPAKALSGGERNRLLLAKLFTRSFNLLVMDEPTNDLDMDTLELLEELLVEFKGTLLLVSHDRTFIDHIVTSTLVFDSPGQVNEYVGGYEDWLRQRPREKSLAATRPSTQKQAKINPGLSSKQQKELMELPEKIAKLETEIEHLQLKFAGPGFFQQDPELISGLQSKLAQCEQKMQKMFARWEQLEDSQT
jgi:ATP-binding cassette subfamily F protein uup